MKQKILLILALFYASFSTLQAYEYFTIHFKDGSQSRQFYASDIDSIAYSKIGVDSLEYAEWKVQEIWTADSVYRYWLADIDSLCFVDVDINKVAKDITDANEVVAPIFSECSTIDELSEHLSQIRASEAVEDAWTDNQTLFVKIKDYGTITYLYPPKIKSGTLPFSAPSLTTKMQAPKYEYTHEPIDSKGICVFFQPYNDENPDFKDSVQRAIYDLQSIYNYMDKPFALKTKITPEFFINEMFNYDQVFLLTHGEYDASTNLHWLYTSDEIFKHKKGTALSDVYETIKNFLNDTLSNDKIAIGAVEEIRNGEPYIVYYKKVSEKYIASANRKFQNGTMVFNAACQSLKGSDQSRNYSMANAFIRKGASCYLGYDETNGVGHYGGAEFYCYLLNASSVESSFESIHPLNKYDAQYDAHLRRVPANNSVLNLCISEPVTLPVEYISVENNKQKQLKGEISMANPSMRQNSEYGFLLMKAPSQQTITSITIDDVSSNNAKKYSVAGEFNQSAHKLELTYLIGKALEIGTYYYCSFMREGEEYCYGNLESFEVGLCPDENHPHAIDMGAAGVWACCNVGANSPEDYGGYYAWGETEEKSDYSLDTYKYYKTYKHYYGESGGYTKYCTDEYYGYGRGYFFGTSWENWKEGFADDKTELDVSDDVARQKWGGSWRMPSVDQLENLGDNCTHKWTQVNNVYGQMFTASNGNRIFLPAAGYRVGTSLNDAGSYGSYWSRTLYAHYPDRAYFLYFLSYYVGVYYKDYYDRGYGRTVRPVRP